MRAMRKKMKYSRICNTHTKQSKTPGHQKENSIEKKSKRKAQRDKHICMSGDPYLLLFMTIP